MIDRARDLMYNLIVKRSLICLALLCFMLAAPVRMRIWSLSATGLQPADIGLVEVPVKKQPADLNGDGTYEEIRLADGRVELLQGPEVLWASPESWQVQSASLADLNRDGQMELALLVWRPWQPWPVDRVLPIGGRIAGFQNADGMSCHLILIGWRGQAFGERWAGSALADPLTEIVAADLDGDGRIELAALEGSYQDPPGSPARSLTVWRWNGFGFTLIDRQPGRFQHLGVSVGSQANFLLTTP